MEQAALPIVKAEKIEIRKEGKPTPQSFNGKYLSITALSKETGISSKELSARFEKIGFIERNHDELILTTMGTEKGAVVKKGQYGEYIAWPENILKFI